MKLAKDLVAASAAPLVLSILEDEGESYGYAILQRVHALSDGRVRWTDGMLYPVLHRLEAQHAITSRWRTAPNGRRRKYYSIQRQGRKVLAEHKSQWRLVNAALTTLWGSTCLISNRTFDRGALRRPTHWATAAAMFWTSWNLTCARNLIA